MCGTFACLLWGNVYWSLFLTFFCLHIKTYKHTLEDTGHILERNDLCVCVWVYVWVHMYVCMCVHTYICVYVYICVCTYMYMCTYMYVCVCVCVCTHIYKYKILGLPLWLIYKESICNAGDTGSIPGLGWFPWEGNGNPLQYSRLGNPMDRGAWWAGYSPRGCRVGHNLVTKQQQHIYSRWYAANLFNLICSL